MVYTCSAPGCSFSASKDSEVSIHYFHNQGLNHVSKVAKGHSERHMLLDSIS
uniref:Uncharacterized protein n=1 Tax=Lepeophtheirus salmonis TaxID=72036 RepID=A0A0K2U1E5_LEPSM